MDLSAKLYRYFSAFSLFFLPLIFVNLLNHSFVQGKELFFKTSILCFLLTLSIIILIKKKLNINPFWRSNIFIILSILFFLILLSCTFSKNPIIAFYGSFSRGFGFIVIFYLFVWFLASSLFMTRASIETGLKFSYVSAFFIAFYAILQKFGFDYFFQNFDTAVLVHRSFSFLGNPSYLGQFLALQFFIGLYFIFQSKKKILKILFSLNLTLIFWGIMASETRSSLIAIMIGLFLLFLKYFKFIKSNHQIVAGKNSIKSIRIPLLVLACFIASLFIFAPKFIDTSRFNFSDIAFRSLNSRITLWQAATSLIAKRPFFGYGLETFYVYFSDEVTPAFFNLEEDLNIFADRIHNELLETIYSSGIFAGIIYLLFFIYLGRLFFIEKKDHLRIFLSLVFIIHFIQNEFSFADLTAAFFLAFCAGSLVFFDLKDKSSYEIIIYLPVKIFQLIITLIVIPALFYFTVFKYFFAHYYYSLSKALYAQSYDYAVFSLKKSLYYLPYYSEPWYELMFIDASSLPRGLHYLSQIEGETGNVLAWQGNYYSIKDPALSYEYFKKALQRNPSHPHFIRAYADSLYRNKQYNEALIMYQRYLDLVPPYWKWRDGIKERSKEDQRKYRIFFKNVPDFWSVVNRVEELKKQFNYN